MRHPYASIAQLIMLAGLTLSNNFEIPLNPSRILLNMDYTYPLHSMRNDSHHTSSSGLTESLPGSYNVGQQGN